jgi:hypothetical protein
MKGLLSLYGCLISLACTAQELPPTTEQQLENIGEEVIEDDALLQSLAFYRRHPINLNTATVEELQPLRFLNSLQIAAFLRYRAAFGKLEDIRELQAVPGLDVTTIRKILPYVFAGPTAGLKEDLFSRLRSGERYVLLRWSRTLEKSKGYDAALTTHYLGDRNRVLFAHRYQYKNLLYYGVVADKDAGEQFLKGAQKLGFDFYSVHFFARNLGGIKAIALGDYAVNLGQGLIQWQSLAFGKSVDVMNIKRQSPVLLPYRSSGEFYFNRGAGVTVGFKSWEATAFVSYKKFSGNLAVDSISRFSSFATSGYNRTVAEVADRYRLAHFSAGGNLSYNRSAFRAGLNAVMHRFSLPLQKSNEPYNYFAFHGQTAFNAGFDYSYTYKNSHFFGEMAVDKGFHRAFLHGLMVSVTPKVDVSILYRHLPASFQSLFGNAFTENTLPVNEAGMYMGFLIRPTTGWQVNAYADFYRFPFLKYRVSAPGQGWDYLAQVTFQPTKLTEVYLRYRSEGKPLNEAAGAIMYPVAKVRQNLRLHFASQTARGLTVKGRTEIVWFDKRSKEPQEGFLVFLEATGQPIKNLKTGVRLQYFETNHYDSRIYTYENDVLYSFSIPAFYDKGLRHYFNASYEILKKLTIWVRIAQTAYINKRNVSSGLDEIPGNKKTEIRLQVKLDF